MRWTTAAKGGAGGWVRALPCRFTAPQRRPFMDAVGGCVIEGLWLCPQTSSPSPRCTEGFRAAASGYAGGSACTLPCKWTALPMCPSRDTVGRVGIGGLWSCPQTSWPSPRVTAPTALRERSTPRWAVAARMSTPMLNNSTSLTQTPCTNDQEPSPRAMIDCTVSASSTTRRD